jgi:hypothetical protein
MVNSINIVISFLNLVAQLSNTIHFFLLKIVMKVMHLYCQLLLKMKGTGMSKLKTNFKWRILQIYSLTQDNLILSKKDLLKLKIL